MVSSLIASIIFVFLCFVVTEYLLEHIFFLDLPALEDNQEAAECTSVPEGSVADEYNVDCFLDPELDSLMKEL